MRQIRFFIGLLVSLIFLYLALRDVDFKLVAASFRDIDLRYLSLGVVLQFVSFFCRSYLWKDILSSEKDIRYRHSFEVLMIGYMGNNVLPFRMGEVLRAYAMGKKEGISSTLVFVSIILERLLDLFTLLLFFLALLFLLRLEEWVVLSGIITFTIFILSVLFLYAIAFDLFNLPSALYRWVMQYTPGRFMIRMERTARSFLSGIRLIRNFRHALWLSLLSLLTWGLGTVVLYSGIKAFHLDLPIAAPLLVVVVVSIGIMLPSSPGFIGIFQYLCIISLSYFGVSREISLSFSLLVHLIQYIPTTLLGWIYLTRMHVTGYQTLKRELEKTNIL